MNSVKERKGKEEEIMVRPDVAEVSTLPVIERGANKAGPHRVLH